MNFGNFGIGEILILGILGAIIFSAVNARRRTVGSSDGVRVCCRNCGSTVVPISRNNVNGCFLVVLLFCFIVPGILYWVWSATQKTLECPSCGSKDNFVPAYSPEGIRIAENADRPTSQSTTQEDRDERACPWCAERILVAAKVCKHCKQAVS